MASYEVSIADSAIADLTDIRDYLVDTGTVDIAGRIIDELEQRIISLERSPERGRIVHEITALGDEYRQISHPPYRICYYIEAKTVHIVAVLDGRRDLENLFTDRLLNR